MVVHVSKFRLWGFTSCWSKFSPFLVLYAKVIGWLRKFLVTILASNTEMLPLMNQREKGFKSVALSTADGKECVEGYGYMYGCIFHGSYYAGLGGK